jgi:predicted site-specific integrase-resolvase
MIRTRRQRQRRQQRLEAARQREPVPDVPRGKAADAGIMRLANVPGWRKRPVVVLDRVSTRKQRLKGNLQQAADETISRLRALRIKPVDHIKVAERSSVHAKRRGLMRAVEAARACNGIVVAEFRDRLLRSKDKRVPTVEEFQRFRERVGDVLVATIEDPDLPESEVRSIQTKRGHRRRNAKPGRPSRTTYQPRATEADLRKVKWLRECKCGYGEIALELGRSRATIQSWAKRAERLR